MNLQVQLIPFFFNICSTSVNIRQAIAAALQSTVGGSEVARSVQERASSSIPESAKTPPGAATSGSIASAPPGTPGATASPLDDPIVTAQAIAAMQARMQQQVQAQVHAQHLMGAKGGSKSSGNLPPPPAANAAAMAAAAAAASSNPMYAAYAQHMAGFAAGKGGNLPPPPPPGVGGAPPPYGTGYRGASQNRSTLTNQPQVYFFDAFESATLGSPRLDVVRRTRTVTSIYYVQLIFLKAHWLFEHWFYLLQKKNCKFSAERKFEYSLKKQVQQNKSQHVWDNRGSSAVGHQHHGQASQAHVGSWAGGHPSSDWSRGQHKRGSPTLNGQHGSQHYGSQHYGGGSQHYGQHYGGQGYGHPNAGSVYGQDGIVTLSSFQNPRYVFFSSRNRKSLGYLLK